MNVNDTFRITEPSGVPPVSLAEFKSFARIDQSKDDALCERFLRAATDKAQKHLNVSLVKNRVLYRRDALGWVPVERRESQITPLVFEWPRLDMPLSPVIEVISVSLVFPEEAKSVVDPAYYYLSADRRYLYFQYYPIFYGLIIGSRLFESLEVDYYAGFGEAALDVPDVICLGIMQLAKGYYEARNADMDTIPPGVARTWATYRDNLI